MPNSRRIFPSPGIPGEGKGGGHLPILLRLTVKQYNQMIDKAILVDGSPYELLDGLIIRKDRSAAGENPLKVGTVHVWAIQNLLHRMRRVKRFKCYVGVQQPVSLPPYSEPEPDLSIVLGDGDEYPGHKPTASEVPCVFEVADSSLQRDRTTKLQIYANGGIEQYVIVNLPDRVVEFYSNPVKRKGHYAHCLTLRPGQSLEILIAGKAISTPVNQLLPKK